LKRILFPDRAENEETKNMAKLYEFQRTKELFQPKDKYAILTIGKNILNGYAANTPSLPRWHPLVSGNLHMYDWELLLTGTFDFGEISPLNHIDKVYILRSKNYPTQIIRPKDIVHSTLGVNASRKHHAGFKETIKIWPGMQEVLPEFNDAVNRIAELSDYESLTFLPIFTHGERTHIGMGNAILPYTKLFAKLDKIKGKKLLVLYACYSGSLINILKTHNKRNNYSIIASSPYNMKSTNWHDQAFDDYLYHHFRKRASLAEIKLRSIAPGKENQIPQMLSYFDVQLFQPEYAQTKAIQTA
jgi:hypothetical protein